MTEPTCLGIKSNNFIHADTLSSSGSSIGRCLTPKFQGAKPLAAKNQGSDFETVFSGAACEQVGSLTGVFNGGRACKAGPFWKASEAQSVVKQTVLDHVDRHGHFSIW